VATRERVIQVAQPVEIRQRLAAHAAWRSVLPLVLMTPLAALAIWWLAARNLAPLDRLARDVRARDARSLAPVPTRGLPDEVAPLASALNALLERVRSLLDGQRAFVADAAHELRSPLTALKLQLELLRRAHDQAERDAARDALGEGIGRASRLVEQLLALARAEPDAAFPAQRVDLGAVAAQALADTKPFADSRSIALELRAPAPTIVVGDPLALGLLVRNLVDNAARYSPPGSRVEVQVLSDTAGVLLQVDDAGPGIPAAEHERVFDRFYRRPDHGESGSGLGLAIVRSVARAHGATVKLDRSALGGLSVAVRFPAP
jgi:two-component system OmpR family sensor kinase/two-component system sensor histidine kinase QseC